MIPVGGVETFAWAILPRLLKLESPMSFGIARDATLFASDPVALKLLLDEADAATVDAILPYAVAIDFARDTRRVRFAELTDGLIALQAVRTRGTDYFTGAEIDQHLRDHPVPEFVNRLLPLAVKAARRMQQLRVINTRERQLGTAQEQRAFDRITARDVAIA
jgi:hypothetical protein